MVKYNVQVVISYFISNVHKEKPYHYLVKLEKPDTLVEMMKIVHKFSLKEDEEEQTKKERSSKKDFKKRKGSESACSLKQRQYLGASPTI